MPGTKRQRESEAANDSTHPSRKAKVQYSEDNAQLAKLYSDLADDVQQLRLSAAARLVQHATAEPSQKEQRLDAALTRLIKGVCSSRKSARLGFSIALSEILRVAFSTPSGAFTLEALVQKIVKLTQVQGNVSGQERRDVFLGRRFAFHAVLQSGVFSSPSTSPDATNAFLKAVAELSAQRQWLRRECGAMLHEYLTTLLDSASGNIAFAQRLVDIWQSKGLWKSPEGVALWLCLTQFEDVKLPKHVWHKRDPLHRQESSILSKVMHETHVDEDKVQSSGSRQIAPSFAWSVVLRELTDKREKDDFARFWQAVVSQGLFADTSSNERKYLGLQVVGIALADLPGWTIGIVLSHNIVHCIINHRVAEDRYLFQASKLTLTQALNRSRREPSVSADILAALLRYGGITFDRRTKTKTIETLGMQADASALREIGNTMHTFMSTLDIGNQDGGNLARADADERMAADLLVSILRSKKSADELFDFHVEAGKRKLQTWVITFFGTLVATCYSHPQSTKADRSGGKETPASMLQSKLMSCLAHFLTLTLDLSYSASRKVLDLIQSARSKLPENIGQGKSIVLNAISKLDDANWALGSRKSEAIAAQLSLKLLLCTTIIEVYNGDPDAVSILDDIIMAIDSNDRSGESHIVLVEIILGYISKPSRAYKRLAEQVFSSFATSMTDDTLQSLYDIIQRKESLSGQQELFDEEQDLDGEESGAGSAMDVEEESDVEIVNGVVVESAKSAHAEDDTSSGDDTSEVGSDSDSDSSSEQSAPSVNEDEDEDEEAIFDRKLAEALGSAGFTKDDEDDDGSDMDDEQMMELEPHLAKVFKERKKQTSTKQNHKDARENIINFKSRVLDLLTIFVKNAYAGKAALSTIIPLIQLIRSTSSKMLSEKSFSVLKQYVDACNKNKVSPGAGAVETADGLWDVLDEVHAQALSSPSKLHTTACSRASLFIAKALVALDIDNYKQIAELYATLQVKWYTSANATVHNSFFTEWTSWSITTRKAA